AERTGEATHDVAVVLGSGWAQAADALGTGPEVPLADLGGVPQPTVPGHVPLARSVSLGAKRVLVFLGRTHLYEGHPVAAVVHGVRTAAAAGCRVIVLTNAAGGIRGGGRPVRVAAKRGGRHPGRAAAGPAGVDQRPPEPDRPVAAGRPAAAAGLP